MANRKEYLRNYQREWLRQRRADFFSDKCCAKCSSKQDLELDHIDRTKKIRRGDHRIWSWSLDKQLEELKKCQVLCYECHIQKTASENQKPIKHGNSGYDRKCRCDICKTAHSERMKGRIRR